MTKILGIQIKDRIDEADKLQDVLTKYGCSIRTRLGLHETGSVCSPMGIIVLELAGDTSEWTKLESALSAISGIAVKSMEF